MNLIPEHTYDPPTGQIVHNGAPVKSAHLAEVDEYSSWLAMVAHPTAPHILTGANTSMAASDVQGIATTSASFSDWVYLDMIIPPFVNWVQWGVVALGYGQVRIHNEASGGQHIIKVQAEDYDTAAGKTSGAMVEAWATKAMTTYDADSNAAMDVLAGGTSGCRHPRLVTVKYQIKRTDTFFAVVSMLYRYHITKPGTTITGYATSGGGGTDL